MPIVCGNVLVNQCNWIFGDPDGIAVIPQSIADKVIEIALEKVDSENIVRGQ